LIFNKFNTFDSLHISELKELSDGSAFAQVLVSIDSKWFTVPSFVSSNWMMKFNNLLKIFKLVVAYFEQVLGQSVAGLEKIDFTAITKEDDESEILKYAILIITIAVQCKDKQFYLEKLGSLSPDFQSEIMMLLDKNLKLLKPLGDDTLDIDDSFGSADANGDQDELVSKDKHVNFTDIECSIKRKSRATTAITGNGSESTEHCWSRH
jgi:protein HOOK3